jgi:hypothetical protein
VAAKFKRVQLLYSVMRPVYWGLIAAGVVAALLGAFGLGLVLALAGAVSAVAWDAWVRRQGFVGGYRHWV